MNANDKFISNSNFRRRVYLRLYHGHTLHPQHFDRLKHIDHTFVPHALEEDAESNKDTRSTDTRTESWKWKL